MSEKRFLTCILIEGIVLMVLGLCVLILPKITELSFGVMLSASFISYGIYKIIHSVMNRNYSKHFWLTTVLGAFLLTIGTLLLLVPKISLLWLIALTGVYFIFESISTTAFVSQVRNMYGFWGCKFFSAIILMLIGLLIVIGIPATSFWLVAMLCGLGLLVKGISKITFYNANIANM